MVDPGAKGSIIKSWRRVCRAGNKGATIAARWRQLKSKSKKQKARFSEAGFSTLLALNLTTEFWLPDLDSNQGPAD
jgi:hypothetical protein